MIFKENDGTGMREVYYMKEPVIFSSESSDDDGDTKDVEHVSPETYELKPLTTYCPNCEIRETPTTFKRNTRCDVCDHVLEYECYLCHRHYKTRKTLRRHQIDVCFPKERFSCRLCDFKTKRRDGLRSHHKSMHQHNGDVHTCDKCGASYKHRTHMLRHHRWCGNNPIKCEHCEYRTPNPDYMRDHINNKHTNKLKMLKCKKCGGFYKLRRTLLRHQIICSAKVKRQCYYCDYLASSKAEILTHLRTEHKEEFSEGK